MTALFRLEIIPLSKNIGFLYLMAFSQFKKNRTIVKLSRTIGGFEIFLNRTIVKSVLIETVLSREPFKVPYILPLVTEKISTENSRCKKFFLINSYLAHNHSVGFFKI